MKSLQLSGRAADELIEYIEQLAENTWIDVSRVHLPVRKALHFYAGSESGFGARIPFSVYKKVVEDVQREESKLQKSRESKGDPENDAFAADVESAQGSGMDLEQAIEVVSGAGNLGMLAEGMAEGFVQMIENMLPEFPIPEFLRKPIDPVREFMNQGVSELPQSDFLDKLSPAWKYMQSKQQEKSPQRILNYAYHYALNRAGTDVAKLWEAWAMYPALKNIKVSADLHMQSAPKTGVVQTTTAGGFVASQTQHWNQYLRDAAILFSNHISVSLACCTVGTLVNLDKAKDFISKIRLLLSAVQELNANFMKAQSFSTANFSKQAQQAIAGAIMTSMNENFNRQVEELRRLWNKVEESLGELDCIYLSGLFDGLIGILADAKNKAAAKLRAIIRWEDASWKAKHGSQLTLIEGNVIQGYLKMLDTAERILDIDASCPVDGSTRDRRAIDIIKKLHFEQIGFNGHIQGSPLPPGMDPDYPLANLTPITTTHGFLIEPGIQGSDLPNEELEELFRRCRQGRFEDANSLVSIPGLFRRK